MLDETARADLRQADDGRVVERDYRAGAHSAEGAAARADGRAAPPPAQVPAPVAEQPAQAPVVEAERKPKSKKRFVLAAIVIAAIAGGSWFGHRYWTEGRFFVSTDDAYIAADMSILSPKISGYVDRVTVEENEIVKAGQPLVVIDDGDYRLALRSAEAKIATQRAAFDRLHAQRDAAEAQVGEADATRTAALAALSQAGLDLQRASDLVTSGVGAKSQRDNAQSARDSAAAKVAGADATISAAKANVGVLDAQGVEAEKTISELEIARDKAERDMTFTTLKAPYDGIVGNLSVQPGDYVAAGRRLAAMVPLSKIFIDANFKETQLADIVPGSKVKIEVDALPGRDLTGTVTSLSPASGSVFSLLPTDNATGNFTKVVQRVPVRVAIDVTPDLVGKLRPGLSAVVAIDTRTAPATPPAVVPQAATSQGN